MARILVADDNSNIQRMVGLALKDQGIDVVAVGNGEAAVRKISELHPDLVLADVFMPVRNGYEVCQYVKEDASLAHIPVILLVGAFDPLDEQEAQRVGADGVLKKPFVPPDPLIAMVKAALQRAGVSLKPEEAEKAAAASPRKGSDLLPQAPPPQAPTPRVSPLAGVSFSSGPASFAPVVGDESFVGEPPAPEPARVDAPKHTLAFGNLLGSTTAPDDREFAADTEIPKASDWRSADDEPDDVPEEEEEEAEESAPSWRRDGADTVFADDGSGAKDWRESAVADTVGRQSARETWEQPENKSGFESAAEVPSEVPAGMPTEMGAFASEMNALEAESAVENSPESSGTGISYHETSRVDPSEHVQEPSDTTASSGELKAAEPEYSEMPGMKLPRADAAEEQKIGYVTGESSDTERPFEDSKELPAELAASDVAIPNETVVAAEEVEATAATEPVAHDEPTHVEAPAHAEEKTPEPVAINSWFSRPASPWDVQRKSPLTSTWDTPSGVGATSESTPAVEETTEARATNGQASLEEIATVISDEPAAQAVPTTSESTAPVDMDALIAKVLARMSPDVMQTLTRELLKPMVAALVADELKKK
ncbi:MAG: response regulator [Acidobacteriota bacterium]|nr:response regulator [Acidobacteriota bacterium]